MQIDSADIEALREAKTLGSQLAAPSMAIHVRVSKRSSQVSNTLYAQALFGYRLSDVAL
jgi:hypothetical protein